MYRICRRLSDGRIIESQSGAGSFDSLIANAVAAGLTIEAHEFVQLDDGPFTTAINAQIQAELPTADQLEDAAKVALDTGGGNINLMRLLKAKFVSDLAFRLGKAPGALTGPELAAERDRIAAIYKAL